MKKTIKYILVLLTMMLTTQAWAQNVAKIVETGIEYATLAEAIDAADPDATIVLVGDITNVTSSILIEKTITLDLNGHTISGSKDNMITVTAGSLTIDDSSTNKNGSISTTEKTAIYFGGAKLTINNGTVEAVTADMYSGAMTVCASAGAVEVNGGTVRGQSTSAYASARAIHMEGTSTSLTVNGGTVEAQCAASYGYAYALECTSGSNVAVSVTDGTINATTGGSRTPVIVNNTSANSTVSVSGGTFNTAIPVDQCAAGFIPADNGGSYGVKAGWKVKFDSDGGSKVATQAVENNGTATKPADPTKTDYSFDGWFAVGASTAFDFTTPITEDVNLKAQWKVNVAKIGDVGYTTLQDAINAAVTASIASGNEVTVNLLTDVTDGTGLALFNNAKGTYPAANGANVKIDFGTHTYTVAGPAVGSTNTQNQVLHFEQGNTITLTNGTINMTDDATALAGFEMFMQNYGTLIIDNMTIDGTGISVATYASSYGTPWGGTTKPQFNYNTAGSSVIRNSTITMPGDMGIDDNAALTIEDDAVINVNAIVTKGTDARYTNLNPTISVENGAQFKLADASKAAALETLLNTTNNQSLGTAVNGVYTVQDAIYVASITVGGTTTKYTSLETAFAAVEDGQTINMLTDVTLSNPLNINVGTKAVTLDLGGKTLTGRTNLKQGNVTIKNGTVAGGAQQALNVYGSADSSAENYSVLNIASDVTVTADVWGVCMFGPTYNSKPGYGAVINIAGTVHTTGNGKEGAVFVSGNLGNNIEGDMKNVINITGSITSDTDAAIALNGNATVNVQPDAVITGNTAITIKRGTLNVEGGTVHATGLSQIPPSGNLNGTEMSGAAVSMTNTYNNLGSMQVNISGGSFTSDHAMALYKEDDSYTKDATYAVSGGIFNTPVPEEFCAPNFVPTSITTQGFTQYTVEPGDFVAQIGDTKYITLAAAVAAVPTNGLETTITLLKDITLVNNVVVGGTYGTTPKVTTAITNQNVKLDLAGHTITGTKTLYLAGGSLNIIGTGSIISTSPDVAPVGVRYVKTDNYPDLDYTSKRTLTIGKNVTLTGAQYGLNIFGTNEASTANNIDVTVDGTVNGMLFVLGNISNDNNNINIDVNGTVDASGATGSEKVKTGIALSGNANVTVADGATVSGESGIEVRAGNLTVNGGTITATSADYSYETNGSGTTTKGAAIAVAQHGTKAATSATILGGATLNGTKKIAVIDAQNNGLAGVTVIAADGYLENSETETVLPEGYYWLTNGDETSSPASNSAVAQIGNTLYSTLVAAVAAVPADGTPTTITLLQNINLTERLFVNAGASPAYAGSNNRYATTTENKNITLELNGHNIVSNSNIALAGGSLNITNNGTADDTHGVISTTNSGCAPVEVRGTGDLTSKRTLTIGENVTLKGAVYGLNVFGSNDDQKNIIDVNVNGTVEGMLFVLGNLKNAANEININVNGTVDASGVNDTDNNEKVHSGIALGGNANVTVADGATVKGESGIEVRAGSLTVNGGTIQATVDAYSYDANGNGMTTKGAAIAVAQHSTVRPIDVTLNGGTLTGAKKIVVTDVNINYLTDVSVVANNSFVANVTDTEIPAGFLWVDNGNNTKKLVLAPARIGNVGYATLAEAIAAVQNGEIIKLYADITLTDDIACTLASGSTFTIDFNNHNVIRNGNHVVLPAGVSVLTNVAASQLFAAAGDNVVVESTVEGDYTHKYSVTKSIANSDITVTVSTAIYNGAEQTPTVVVKDGDTVLEADTHYQVTFSGGPFKDAKTYSEGIIITGIGTYADVRKEDFTIDPRNINDVTVEGNSQPYSTTGYSAADIKGYITLKYNTETLQTSDTDPKDYTIAVDGTVTYKDGGTYPEVITLTAVEGGNYTGSRKVNFYIGNINDKDIATCNVVATVTYNGASQVPSATTVIVKDASTNEPLTADNYDLTFTDLSEGTNNYVNAGTYANAVTIIGKNGYYGTKTVDYIIMPKDISTCDIMNSTPFTGSVIDPATVVKVMDNNAELVANTDYTLSVSDGYTYHDPQTYTAALTITGKGNYTGTVVKDFTITNPAAAIDISEIGMVESYVKFNGKNQPPSRGRLIVSLKDPNTGAKTTLVYNQDYTFTFNGIPADYYDAKTYSHAVTITGIGNYYGSFTADYVISPRELTERYIVCEAVDPLVWTGSTLKLNVNSQIDGRTDNNVILKLVNTAADPDNNIPEDAYMLSSAKDYTYTTEPVTMKDPGEYVVTFTGRYNFTGKRTVTVKVLKDINQIGDSDIEIPVQILGSVTPNIRPSNIQDMVVRDGSKVLEQGIHYTLTFKDSQGNIYQGGSGPYITQQGKYTAVMTGKDPYYTGEKTKDFVVVNEYYAYNAPETGEKFGVHITSGKELTATVGAKTGAAIDVASTSMTVKSAVVVSITDQYDPNYNTSVTFTVNGIDNGAFNGANNLHWLDITALEGYTPATLDRSTDRGPFAKVPKQTLVFLDGTTATGENYIYKFTDTDFRCDELKIYDDISGVQTSFTEQDGYKWGFENPYEFKANTVTNTRQLNSGNGYTIYLPYALPTPTGIDAYTLSASKNDLLGFLPVAASTLEALTPYVLLANASGQLLSTTNATVKKTVGVAITEVTSQAVSGQNTYTMYGNLDYNDGIAGAYIMQGGNVWKKIDTLGSEGQGACILPMRAYIVVGDGSPAPALQSVFGMPGATDMDIFDHVGIDVEDGQYYDLQGRPVETPSRGVYVRNGKKVVIK